MVDVTVEVEAQEAGGDESGGEAAMQARAAAL